MSAFVSRSVVVPMGLFLLATIPLPSAGNRGKNFIRKNIGIYKIVEVLKNFKGGISLNL